MRTQKKKTREMKTKTSQASYSLTAWVNNPTANPNQTLTLALALALTLNLTRMLSPDCINIPPTPATICSCRRSRLTPLDRGCRQTPPSIRVSILRRYVGRLGTAEFVSMSQGVPIHHLLKTLILPYECPTLHTSAVWEHGT